MCLDWLSATFYPTFVSHQAELVAYQLEAGRSCCELFLSHHRCSCYRGRQLAVAGPVLCVSVCVRVHCVFSVSPGWLLPTAGPYKPCPEIACSCACVRPASWCGRWAGPCPPQRHPSWWPRHTRLFSTQWPPCTVAQCLQPSCAPKARACSS